MEQHPIDSLMKTAMENIKEMVDVNTIIGDPVEMPGGRMIIPVSKVGFGFAAGGSEFGGTTQRDAECGGKKENDKKKSNDDGNGEKDGSYPFGGGSGGGVSITPVAFILIGENEVRVINMEGSAHLYDRVMDLLDKVTNKKKKGNVSADIPPNPYC